MSLFFLIFGGVKKLIRFFMLVLIFAYISAGMAGVSLQWFPAGWTAGWERPSLPSLNEVGDTDESIIAKVQKQQGDEAKSLFDKKEFGFEDKLSDLLIFLKPAEVISVMNTRDGLIRSGVIFVGLFLLSWLRSGSNRV
jgi:hypothetical protein